MVKSIWTIYPHGLNKGFGWRIGVGYGGQQYTSEEGGRTHRQKRWEYDNEEKDKIWITLTDKKKYSRTNENYKI